MLPIDRIRKFNFLTSTCTQTGKNATDRLNRESLQTDENNVGVKKYSSARENFTFLDGGIKNDTGTKKRLAPKNYVATKK